MESKGGDIVKNRPTRYAWYVLAICVLVEFLVLGLGVTIMPPLFPEMRGSLGASDAELLRVWGMWPLAMMLFSIPGGMAADRWGFKPVVGAGIIISALFVGLRGTSDSITELMVYTFLFGLGRSFVYANIPKVIGYYFPPRMFGTAMGICFAGFGISAGLTMTLGPLLSQAVGGWNYVMYGIGGLVAIIGVLWLLTIREPKHSSFADDTDIGHTRSDEPFWHRVKGVLAKKDMWIFCAAALFFGAAGSIQGYMPLFYSGPVSEGGRGYGDTLAAALPGAMLWAMVVGTLLLPIISDKVGRRKWFLVPGGLIVAVFVFLAYAVEPPGLWVVMILWGLSDYIIGFPMFLPAEHPEIGPELAGTASGLVTVSRMLMASVGPMIGGALIGVMGPIGMWGFVAISIALGGLVCVFATETGPITRRRRQSSNKS